MRDAHPSEWNRWPVGGDYPPAGCGSLTRLPPETYSVVRLSDGAPLGHWERTRSGLKKARRFQVAAVIPTRIVESVTKRNVSAVRPNFAQVVRSRHEAAWEGQIDWRVVG